MKRSGWLLLVLAFLCAAGGAVVSALVETDRGDYAVLLAAVAAVLALLLVVATESAPALNAIRDRWLEARREWPSGPSKASIVVVVLIGLTLAYHFDEHGPLRFLHHIGIGLVVAGAVSAVWQLSEMKNFFIELAVAVMVDAKYLKKLDRADLESMREKSIDAIFRRYVKNPVYEIETFTHWLDQLLIKKLLPTDGPESGMYRTDFREHVAIEFLTLADVLRAINVPLPTTVDGNLQLIRQTAVTTYRVIAPSMSIPSYPVKLEGWAADLPVIPISHRVKYRVGTSQEQAEDVEVDPANDPKGGITYGGTKSLNFVDGSCEVWTELVEYRSVDSESWILNSLNMLTYRLDADVFVINSPEELSFEGRVTGGLGLEAGRKSYLPNGMAFQYDGWLLEDHGYFVWWWKKVRADLIVDGLSCELPAGKATSNT